jgi:Fe-S-cluster containining protein
VVSLLGYDVWRISRELHLSPELFVLVHDQPEPADDGFLLEPNGRPQGLALDKQGEFHPKQPCVFLLELGGGHARCGIYQHRPAVCRTYPMALRDVVTQVRGDALCPPGAWSEEQIGDPEWRGHLAEYQRRWEEYVEVVDRWNERVRSAGIGRFSGPEYLRYLMNMYDTLAMTEEGVVRPGESLRAAFRARSA